jgi:hypothetical protein
MMVSPLICTIDGDQEGEMEILANLPTLPEEILERC